VVAHPVTDRPHIVVIGAGFAGLTTAVALVDAGCRVTVFDRAPRGGGRASVFVDRESGERIDNGQHVLFGCYRHTYEFLRRIGSANCAPLQPQLSLSMVSPAGVVHRLTCPAMTPPFHLMAGVLRWSALSWRDRLSTLRMAGVIRGARAHGAAAVAGAVAEQATVEAWLDQMRQTRGIRDWLWHPLAFAALNQAPGTAAARPFVRVIGELFGPRPEDAAVGLANVPLDELYVTPAVRAIEAQGSIVRLKTEARVIVGDHGVVIGVRTPAGIVQANAVVSAVPWFALADVLPDPVPEPLGAILRHAAALDSSPIVTVNLWLDGPVLPAPFLGFVDGPMHWAFDRRAIVGTSPYHVSMVASGAADLVRSSNDETTAAAVAQLARVLPGMRERRVLRSLVVREQRATFSLAPGGPPRPGPATGLPGFVLAGDWTDTGLPATIEGAVWSGRRAAEVVLRGLP
jgi:squalene-associated FAD-dependent desaturase